MRSSTSAAASSKDDDDPNSDGGEQFIHSHLLGNPKKKSVKQIVKEDAKIVWDFGLEQLDIGVNIIVAMVVASAANFMLMAVFIDTAFWAMPAKLAAVGLRTFVVERFLFYLGQLSTLNFTLKFALMLVFSVPYILAFGLLYHRITNTSMKDSMIKFYGLVHRLPGAAVLTEKSTKAAVLVNFVFYIGLLTFAVFLGFVTEEVKQWFKGFKSGRFPVNQTAHTLVLGWNSHAVHLLQNMVDARKQSNHPFFRRAVVILSSKNKLEMDDAIMKQIGKTDLEFYTRHGSPVIGKDLALVDASSAATVILLQPDDLPHDTVGKAHMAATAMALTTTCNATRNIVVQCPPTFKENNEFLDAMENLSCRANSVQALTLTAEDFEQRFTVLEALQPGIMQVYQQLLGPGPPSFHTQDVPEALVGRHFKHVRRCVDNGHILAGIMREGKVDLLVRELEPVQAADKLIFLSTSDTIGTVPLSQEMHEMYHQAAVECAPRPAVTPPSSKEVVIVSMNPAVVDWYGDDFAEFAPDGSRVTFIVPVHPKKMPRRAGGCTFNYIIDKNPASLRALRSAGIDTASSVIIAGVDHLKPEAGDAFVAATVMQIQSASEQTHRAKAPHVIGRVRMRSTSSTVKAFLDILRQEAKDRGRSMDIVVPPPQLFISDGMEMEMLMQSAADTSYLPIMNHLLSSAEGAEVYLRNPKLYNLPTGEPISYASVVEASRWYCETAVGLYRFNGLHLQMLPNPAANVTLEEGDRIVVLARDSAVKSHRK